MRKIRLRAPASQARRADEISAYFAASSGCQLVIATPSAEPTLWEAFLQGARVSYRRHGVERVLEYDNVVGGHQTALFFAAVTSNGRVVGGMRAQGPYLAAGQAHALQEWAGRSGSNELRREITQRIPAGVIEMKTGWVDDDFHHRHELSAALARIFIHSMTLLDARYAMCTVGAHAVQRWQTTGGVVSSAVAPVAYPDDRYLTKLMWWDSQNYHKLAAAEQLPLVIKEAAQLANPSAAMPARSPVAA
jgi:hypothetical protein